MLPKVQNISTLGIIILGYCLIIVLFKTALPKHHPVEQISENSAEKLHWSYGGSGNPTRWGTMAEEYALCDAGNSQSPVDIASKTQPQEESQPIQFNYQPIALTVKNNGHTIQVDYPPGSFIKIDGNIYKLLQFHFHTPSEHTIDGIASAMEMHLVHQSSQGKLAVVGVLIEAGSENYFLKEILENLPETEEEAEVEGVKINVETLLPNNRSYYSYSGSLTTPPCSEGVSWNVMKTPITASAEQIEQFMEIYQMNARPVQPLNRRKVQLIR